MELYLKCEEAIPIDTSRVVLFFRLFSTSNTDLTNGIASCCSRQIYRLYLGI